MPDMVLVNTWLSTVSVLNEGLTEDWALRCTIDGVQLVEQAVKRLEAIGVTLEPNGNPLEYFVEFPPPVVREVVTILVEQGATLCENQEFPDD